mmetsp:Transcript_40349/g.78530  ORF Transcript_40349/g.78530 Transcript_40349/m.78530 type:complete len:238 (+) Transcript_40349:234-947(+)
MARTRDLDFSTSIQLRGIVLLEFLGPKIATHCWCALNREKIRLTILAKFQINRVLLILEFRDMNVSVAVDLHGGFRLGVGRGDEMPQLVLCVYLRPTHAAVVRLQPPGLRCEPHLDEAQGLFVQVVLRVANTRACSHELDGALAQGLLRAHRILVCQLAMHDVRAYFGVAVGVLSESALGLDEVVVHDAEDTEVGVRIVVVLNEKASQRQHTNLSHALRGWCQVIALPQRRRSETAT